MADLITAAKTRLGYASNELASGDKEATLGHLLKAQEYIARAAAPLAPPTPEDPDIDAEPLSDQAGIAIHQILAATGHSTTFNTEGGVVAQQPEDVIADASEEQVRELALLGYFGQIGTRSDVDYSLREQYFHINDKGVEVLTSDTPDTLTSENYWADYLKSKA